MKTNVIKSVAVRYSVDLEGAVACVADSGHPFRPDELRLICYEGGQPSSLNLSGWAIRVDGSIGNIRRERIYRTSIQTPEWVLSILKGEEFDPIVRLWAHGLK